MPKLSDVPFSDLFIGQHVVSEKGTDGVITELLEEDDNTICIQWSNGNMSKWYHHLMGMITLKR